MAVTNHKKLYMALLVWMQYVVLTYSCVRFSEQHGSCYNFENQSSALPITSNQIKNSYVIFPKLTENEKDTSP